MDESKTRYGSLILSHKSSGDNYHCSCVDCGVNMILTKEQLDNWRRCACEVRRHIFSASGGEVGEFAEERPAAVYRDDIGVNFDKKKNKWRARITFQGREYHLGYFADKESAASIRREAFDNFDKNFHEWFRSISPGKGGSDADY